MSYVTLRTHVNIFSFVNSVGFAGLFTMFSSFVFGSGVVNLIDQKVSGLK